MSRWRVPPPLLSAAAACLVVGACASMPPSPYSDGADSLVLAPGIEDRQSRFREIFCTVLEARESELPDVRPCNEALTEVGGGSAELRGNVDLDRSRRPLLAAVVEGIGWECFAGWLEMTDSIGDHLRSVGYDWTVIPVESLSSSELNAEMIRDSVMDMEHDGEQPRIVLIGYSKGAPDILTAIVSYPEIRDRVAAVVSVAGAIGGSPIAEKTGQSTLELLRHFPRAECGKGDRGAMESLRPAVREAWLDANPLPDEILYYSLLTCPEPDRISKVLKSSYKKLAKTDARNDGMMLIADQVIPSSSFLGCVNADHRAVSVPIARTRPKIAKRYVDHNDYPREALFEAILRFVDEDLDARIDRVD